MKLNLSPHKYVLVVSDERVPEDKHLSYIMYRNSVQTAFGIFSKLLLYLVIISVTRI
jgi:hypothetical protein